MNTAPTGIFMLVFLFSGFFSLVFAAGCQDEQYYGPYHVRVPSPLMERSNGRTFRLPLSGSEAGRQDALDRCIASDTPRTLPCECDHPVITLYHYLIQMDYRVVLESDNAAEVLIWLGKEVELNQPYPRTLPDFPRIEVIMSHRYLLAVEGRILDASFLEKDITDMLYLYSRAKYRDCNIDRESLPVPTRLIFGISQLSGAPAIVGLDATFRIRRYK